VSYLDSLGKWKAPASGVIYNHLPQHQKLIQRKKFRLSPSTDIIKIVNIFSVLKNSVVFIELSIPVISFGV